MRNAQNHINALGEGNHENRFVLHGNEVELLGKVTQESPDAADHIDFFEEPAREIQYLRKYPKGTEDCF